MYSHSKIRTCAVFNGKLKEIFKSNQFHPSGIKPQGALVLNVQGYSVSAWGRRIPLTGEVWRSFAQMTFSLMPPTAAVDAGQPQVKVTTLPKLVIAFGDKGEKKKTAMKGFKCLICWAEGSFAPSAPCDCRFIHPTSTWGIQFREAWVIWLFKIQVKGERWTKPFSFCRYVTFWAK